MEKTTLLRQKAIALACLLLAPLLHAQNNDDFARIRLGFNSANGFHRQLLLGFMDEFATADFDPGYDAVQIDNQPNDMYFQLGSLRLVIQGVGAFDANAIFPLEIKTAISGTISFTLDATENFNAEQPIYIHDATTNEYHNLRDGAYFVAMPIGVNDDRFSLRFTKPLFLSTNNPQYTDRIIIRYANKEQVVNVRKQSALSAINSVEVYDVQGQRLNSWIVQDQLQEQFPIRQTLSNGTYIIKVQSSEGDVSKKIMVDND
jgi:hypothetical protein